MRDISELVECVIVPDSVGFNVAPVASSKFAKLDGAASRFGRSVKSNLKTASLSWNLIESEYDYIRALYRTVTKRGALPFLIPLIVEANSIGLYYCNFVPGVFKISNAGGIAFKIEAMIEIEPTDYSALFDISNLLAKLVNVDLAAVS